MTKPVTVYSKTDCKQCNFTKKWLTEHNIDYIEIDVEEDTDSLNYIKYDLGYQAVPVIVTETDSWYGFPPDKLAKLAR